MSKNTNIADLINYIFVDGSGNVVLASGQQVATQTYVTTAISNLVNSAPAALDTLAELATALNNDASFATTITNSIAGKLNLSGGTLTGALSGTSATFSDIVTNTTGGIRTASSLGFILRNDANNANLGGFTRRGYWVGSSALDTQIFAETGYGIFLNVNGSQAGLVLASTGAATFSSSVTAVGISSSSNSGATNFLRSYNGTSYINMHSNGANAEIKTNGNAPIYFQDGTSGQVYFTGGNVGIGTTSPTQLLVVSDNNTNGTAVNINNISSGGYNWNIFSVGSAATIAPVGSLAFRDSTNGVTRMTITSGGNVGIGTSSPVYKLVVSKGGAEGIEFDAGTIVSGKNYIINYNRSTGSYIDLQIDSNNTLFSTSGSERMRITSGGNVLIGTTSNPFNYQFLVNNTAYVKQLLAFGTSVDDRYIGQGNQISGAYQSYDLTLVNYAASARVVITNSNAGVILNNGATSWSSFSDERLKNINGNIENALDKLLSIRAVKYSWKTDEKNKENLGLIAQDIQKVFPQVIDVSKSFNENDNEEYLSVKYTELIPVLVAAIQEQNQLIQEIKAENDELREILKRNNII